MCELEGIRDKVLSVRKLEVFIFIFGLVSFKKRERTEDKEEAARW